MHGKMAAMTQTLTERRVALVTGVSRRGGIGYAIACRLAGLGFDLALTHYAPHDQGLPWGGDDIDAVVAGVQEHLLSERCVIDVSADLADPEAPARIVAFARERLGRVDVLVANHARSGGDGPLLATTASMLDGHWAVNARSSLLLAKEVASGHDGRPGGRIVFLTSGQQLGPMPDEVSYAAAKAALAGITSTIAHELAPLGFTVNCVNPGPVDSDSYVDDDLRTSLAGRFPFGRWGEPDDPARLIAWLVSDEGRWVTGQVINTEGGFVR